jgi:hypothetical protein
MRYSACATILLGLTLSLNGFAKPPVKPSISGYLGGEIRLFQKDGIDPVQENENVSLVLQPEFRWKFPRAKTSLTFIPFARLDQHDDERSHVDIRELLFHKRSRKWELRYGIGKVFWGVTESQHLVDIINQTDAIEAPDGEEKLGQPMIHLKLKRKWGTTDLYVLPYFRERTFAGSKGRLRTSPVVDTSQTLYESGREEKHVDFAARWSHYIGKWDLGVSHFSGTSRDPRFQAGVDGFGNPVLIPIYDQIDQTGIDVQATQGNWLWKLEWINRRSRVEDYWATTLGFEYTRAAFMKTRLDLGLLMEYLYDDRQDKTKTPFDDDVMIGARLTFNDVASSQMLAGIILDNDNDERLYFVEFSRRLGKSYKLSIEVRANSNATPTSPLYSTRYDDHIQFELRKYF